MKSSIKMFGVIVSVASALVFLTSCGQEQAGGGKNYKDEKTMVLDILKSAEGKKAIESALSGEDSSGGQGSEGGGQGAEGGGGSSGGGKGKMKTLNTSDTKELKMVVKEVLTNPENGKFMQSMMQDPKFAGEFAKATQKETKQLYMDLMKDPDYQKELLDVMKNQEFQTILMNTLKTMKSRQQMKIIVQDTMQSPLFKAELVTLLKKSVEEYLQESEKKQQKQGKGQGGGEGGGGGGGEGDQGEGGAS